MSALDGQNVVVIGGSAGIGLGTARRARAEGAEIIVTGRTPERLERAAQELGARGSAAFDATDARELEGFLDGLATPVDHVMVTAGAPYYAPLRDMDRDKVREDVEAHLLLALRVGRLAIGRVRPGGTLLFIGGTGGRRPDVGLVMVSALTAAMPALIANIAIEVAPVRVNLIACGFVDTPLSAALLGDGLEGRREQLRATLPIGRVVGPDDVGALAVHIMAGSGGAAVPLEAPGPLAGWVSAPDLEPYRAMDPRANVGAELDTLDGYGLPPRSVRALSRRTIATGSWRRCPTCGPTPTSSPTSRNASRDPHAGPEHRRARDRSSPWPTPTSSTNACP